MTDERTVRDEILDVLNDGPLRYSEIVKRVQRPDKTVFVNLNGLDEEGYVKKNVAGQWEITLVGKNGLQLKRLYQSLEEIGLQEHYWGPGKLGYRSMKLYDRIKREGGEAEARRLGDTIGNAAISSLRLFQSPHVELTFKQYMKLQDYLGGIIKSKPYSPEFALVVVFQPREALQRTIQQNMGSWKYTRADFTVMLAEIRTLWTKKAWVETVFR